MILTDTEILTETKIRKSGRINYDGRDYPIVITYNNTRVLDIVIYYGHNMARIPSEEDGGPIPDDLFQKIQEFILKYLKSIS